MCPHPASSGSPQSDRSLPRRNKLPKQDAWVAAAGGARIFVEALVFHYTAVFVGYSHDDPPIRYVARGMGRKKQALRFSITHTDARRWERLGVVAIPFALDSEPEPFARFSRGVARWSDFTHTTPFGLDERIVAALAQPDPGSLGRGDIALLRWAATHEQAVHYFAQHARNWIWVEWLQQQGLLKQLFQARPEPSGRCEQVLTHWLAEQLLHEPSGRAWRLMLDHRGRIA